MQMPKRTVKTYVRREGRITPGQTRGITQFWKIYGLDATTKIVDFSKIFPKDQPVIIEIGFGMGDSLVQMALENPQFNYQIRPGQIHPLRRFKCEWISNFLPGSMAQKATPQTSISPGSMDDITLSKIKT